LHTHIFSGHIQPVTHAIIRIFPYVYINTILMFISIKDFVTFFSFVKSIVF
jgi:hypothetical protein